MANVLITGAAGFIGSALARAVLNEGGRVLGVDNLSSGNMRNLEEIRSQMEFREADVQDVQAMDDACRGIDYVFHEAAIPSVPKSLEDPIGTNGPNLSGTLVLLEAARKAKVKRLVYAASSAAYGDAPELPKREDMLPQPISPYAVQKVASEDYLKSYARVFGLETVSLRYFNIFGPRQDPTSQYSGVLARFISQMMAGETPTILGDGSTTRDFTYIDNVVNANMLAAKASSAVSGRVINVATGRAVSLIDAFGAIKKIVAFQGEVKFAPERTGDIKHSVADISCAQRMLGYKVTVDFECGLQQTIDWGRNAR